jgi:hypothetical protein
MEEKALLLEAELVREQEKVRDLERIIAQMKLDAEEKKPQKVISSDRPQVSLLSTPSLDQKPSQGTEVKSTAKEKAKESKPTSAKSGKSSGKGKRK